MKRDITKRKREQICPVSPARTGRAPSHIYAHLCAIHHPCALLARPAITVPANVTFTAAAWPARSEDGHSSSGGSTDAPRCPDLNLDLDLSVGPPSSPPKTPAATASTPTSQQQRAPICLCYHLGVRGGEACSCKAASPAAFQFLRPLGEGHVGFISSRRYRVIRASDSGLCLFA
ncbi:hypothetical protein EJB05_18269, partial [Eragrostis curvula]